MPMPPKMVAGPDGDVGRKEVERGVPVAPGVVTVTPGAGEPGCGGRGKAEKEEVWAAGVRPPGGGGRVEAKVMVPAREVVVPVGVVTVIRFVSWASIEHSIR